MKNKRCDNLKYILAKNARGSGNSIIQRWISMLLTGICGTTAGVAAMWVNDYKVACKKIGRLEFL